jgi:hypothetical protein
MPKASRHNIKELEGNTLLLFLKLIYLSLYSYNFIATCQRFPLFLSRVRSMYQLLLFHLLISGILTLYTLNNRKSVPMMIPMKMLQREIQPSRLAQAQPPWRSLVVTTSTTSIIHVTVSLFSLRVFYF